MSKFIYLMIAMIAVVGGSVDIDFDTGTVRENVDVLLRVPREGALKNDMRGPPGARGDMGLKGHSGERGDPGPRGHRGRKGEPGGQGDPGYPGVRGRRGFTGDMGLPGKEGPKGFPGTCAKQRTGQYCLTGPMGVQGPKGLMGVKGWKGTMGQVGKKGEQGKQGDPGTRGTPGMPGRPGMVAGPKCTTRYTQWVDMRNFDVDKQAVMCDGMEFLWNVEAEKIKHDEIRYKYYCCEFLQA